MYNLAALQEAFTSLVGIRQSDLPQIPRIVAPLTLSTSGKYVQSKHPLVTLQNIYYACPDFNLNNWTQWVSGTSYKLNDQRLYNGVIYQAKADIANDTATPDTDATNWLVLSPFQAWLQDCYNDAVSNLFDEVIRRKKITHMAKAIRERQQLYRGAGNIYDIISNDGSFVGFELTIQQAEGLMVILDQFGLQLTEAQEDLGIYLYFSDQLAPMADGTYNITEVKTFTWQDFSEGYVLQYLKQNTTGTYFLGYYQEDLTGEAIQKEWDCTRPCFQCDGSNVQMYNIWSRYTTIRTIKVPSSALDPVRNIFDTSKIQYDNITNWGMNLSLTIRCDLTDFIIYSKGLFADSFAMQLAKDFLDKIAMNSRINPTNNQIQTQARSELDIKFPGSWINHYNDAIEALDLDMSGFSKACMPCNNKNKMSWNTI